MLVSSSPKGTRAFGSGVEHILHTDGVTSSNLVTPTIEQTGLQATAALLLCRDVSRKTRIMILLVDKIEKSFGARTLFSGASFQINAHERYALVGPNGAGKTTMLKIIMGIDAPDAGEVTYAKDVNVGYLEQETKLASDKPIITEVMDAAIEIRSMGERAEELQVKIAEADADDPALNAMLEEYGRVQGPL